MATNGQSTAQTVLITGASSGIGLEMARQFAAHGHNLVLVARSQQILEDLADELTGKHHTQALVVVQDLAQPGAAQAVYDVVPSVDILVNNAGFQVYGEFHEADLAKLHDMMQVNMTALTELTHHYLPGMIQRGHGRIMNVGSTGSFAPGVFNAVYCASKAYVLSFSEAIAEEVADKGVTVTCVCPGATQTPFIDKAGMQDVALFDNTMDPATVAEQAYHATMTGKRVHVTGWQNRMTVFAVRFLPRNLIARTSKRMMRRRA